MFDPIQDTVQTLKVDEGYRKYMYKDTLGFTTIGYGTNLDDGLDREESEAVMRVRVLRSAKRLRSAGLGTIHPSAFSVCLQMCYQLGDAGFFKFRNTIKYLRSHEYRKASYEMLDSVWADQTPERAGRLSLRIWKLE